MRSRFVIACVLAPVLVSCESAPAPAGGVVEEEWIPGGPVQTVTLPDGAEIEAVLRVTQQELETGMMFRHFIPPDKGMLFVFPSPARQAFFMHQTFIPLDMIWLDGAKRIVEMKENAPPCFERDSRKCESYGGNQQAVYVLELAAGQSVAHGLKLGDELKF